MKRFTVVASLVCLMVLVSLAQSRSKGLMPENYGPMMSNDEEVPDEAKQVEQGMRRGKRSTHVMQNEEDRPEETKQAHFERFRREVVMGNEEVPEETQQADKHFAKRFRRGAGVYHTQEDDVPEEQPLRARRSTMMKNEDFPESEDDIPQE